MAPLANKSLNIYCFDQSKPCLKYFNSESNAGNDVEHVPCFTHSCSHKLPFSFKSVQRLFNSGIIVFKASNLSDVWFLQSCGEIESDDVGLKSSK